MKNLFKKINKKSKNKNIFIQKKSGFTIIETLVAIFILLITTTGPLTFAQSGLRTSFLARDQITAFFLAQESVEVLKNIRDTNQLNNTNWLNNFGKCNPINIGNTVSCDIDASVNLPIQCPNNKCSLPLQYDENTGIFSFSGNNPFSKYTRTVHVTMISKNELQIIVDVSWVSQFLAEKRIVIQENIYKKY
jgi:Tfp pilus assembly protein PilV